MAAPTEAQIQTQMNKYLLMLNEADKFLRSNTKNVGAMYDDAIRNGTTGIIGDFLPGAVGGADGFREACAQLVSEDSARAMLDPFILEFGKLKDFPETDVFEIIDRLHDEMAGGSERVTERNFTFGAPSAVSGTGTGVLNRLTLDRYARDLENCTPEAKSFKCVRDVTSGAPKHRELFEIRGVDIPRDFVSGVVGPNRIGEIRALSPDDSQNLIKNPSFHQRSGTDAVPTAITGWEAVDLGDLEIDRTNYYRIAQLEGSNPGALKFKANDKVTQAFAANARFDPFRPYYLQVVFNREVGSGDGTLTIRLGSNSKAVVLSAQTGWNILRLDLDENLWFPNFNTSALDIEIELTLNTTGTVLVDDVILAPMTYWDGTYWALVGGGDDASAEFPFLLEDEITATDSEVGAIIQTWFWRIYNRYLPHSTGGGVTWAEPS